MPADEAKVGPGVGADAFDALLLLADVSSIGDEHAIRGMPSKNWGSAVELVTIVRSGHQDS